MPGFSKKKGSFTTRPEDLDTLDATGLARPSLTTFCRLDELGMIVAGQRRTQNARWWPAAWPTTTAESPVRQ